MVCPKPLSESEVPTFLCSITPLQSEQFEQKILYLSLCFPSSTSQCNVTWILVLLSLCSSSSFYCQEKDSSTRFFESRLEWLLWRVSSWPSPFHTGKNEWQKSIPFSVFRKEKTLSLSNFSWKGKQSMKWLSMSVSDDRTKESTLS
jgi:hypothetical protein